MRKKIVLTLVLALLLALLSGLSAFAQEGDLLPCSGEQISGAVVAVDSETGTVTIDPGDGALCTVTITEGTYQHPIVALLGAYFDDLDIADLESSLGGLQGCVLQEEGTGNWLWVACDVEGAMPARVSARNEDGSFSVVVEGLEEPVRVAVDDPAEADGLEALLESLVVSWNLDENGDVVEAGDQIAAYHEAGVGFGVLVKLYAMARESQEACRQMELQEGEICGATVDELVAAVQSGEVGLGELFKTFGKPAMLGVGHVRHEMRGGKGKPPWAGPKDKNAAEGDEDGASLPAGGPAGQESGKRNQGNGNGNGNGGPKDKPPKGDPPGRGGPPRGRGKK